MGSRVRFLVATLALCIFVGVGSLISSDAFADDTNPSGRPDYIELNGLTIAKACENLTKFGWTPRDIQSSTTKTESNCQDTKNRVTHYYYRSTKSYDGNWNVDFYYTENNQSNGYGQIGATYHGSKSISKPAEPEVEGLTVAEACKKIGEGGWLISESITVKGNQDYVTDCTDTANTVYYASYSPSNSGQGWEVSLRYSIDGETLHSKTSSTSDNSSTTYNTGWDFFWIILKMMLFIGLVFGVPIGLPIYLSSRAQMKRSKKRADASVFKPVKVDTNAVPSGVKTLMSKTATIDKDVETVNLEQLYLYIVDLYKLISSDKTEEANSQRGELTRYLTTQLEYLNRILETAKQIEINPEYYTNSEQLLKDIRDKCTGFQDQIVENIRRQTDDKVFETQIDLKSLDSKLSA
ncbi:hypothetical protein FACS1894125_4710 [Actinomycetota bacterium]|nr:hypothetical protein FACS1894125_4710 [Actinomycetota bacterium]